MDENIGLNEFMEAFADEGDNQIAEEAGETVDESTQTEQDTQTDSTDSNEAAAAETAEKPADGQDPQKEDGKETNQDAQSETFTLKVNKEEKTYSREEVISLAQKGADYDRVKEQLTRSREEKDHLQTQRRHSGCVCLRF